MSSPTPPRRLSAAKFAMCGLLFALLGPLLFQGVAFNLDANFVAFALLLSYVFVGLPSLATGLCLSVLDRYRPLSGAWSLLAIPVGVLVFWLAVHVAVWIAGQPQPEGLPRLYHARPLNYLSWSAVTALACTWAARRAALLSRSN
jgi:hypothetical protein